MSSTWINLFAGPRRHYALLVTLVSALLLVTTVAPDVMPGESALLIAQHTGADVFAPLTHHLWGWVGAGFDTLPYGTPGFRWNLLSALCGAACCGLLVLLTARLPALNARWSQLVGHPRAMANLAGTTAGLLLLGSQPFRIASAIALPVTFELLALLTTCWLLVRYAETASFKLAVAAVVLLALTASQSVTALLLTPVAALALIAALWRHRHLRPATAVLLVALGAAAGLLALAAGATWFTLQPSYAWVGLDGWNAVLVHSILERISELRRDLPMLAVVLVGIYALLPLIMTLLLTNGRGEGRNLLLALLVALGALLFLNFRFTPFPLFGVQPLLVTPYALGAAWFGYLAAYLIGSTLASAQAHYRLRRNPRLARAVSTAGLLLLLLFTATAGMLGQRALKIHAAMRVTGQAEAIAAQLHDHDWVLLHGPLDPLVRLKTRERGRAPLIISAHRITHPPYQRALAAALPSPRLASMVEAGLVPLLRERLHPDHQPAPSIAVLGDPGFLRFIGNTAWPDRAFYWNREPDDLTPAAYLDAHRAWWTTLDHAAPGHPAAELEARIRQLSARIANDAGVWLEDRTAPDLAREAYLEAIRLDPENLSARLNLRGQLPDEHPDTPALDAEIETLSARFRGRRTLNQIMDYYGIIRHEAATRASARRWNQSDPLAQIDPRLNDVLTLAEDDAAFRQAREISADDPAILLNLARLANGADRPRLALRLLESLPDQPPLGKAIRIERAQTAMHLGETDTAYRLLTSMPEADLQDPRALILLALLTVETRPDDCDRYLGQLETFPDRLTALSLPIARIYEARGNRPAALRHLIALTSSQPLNPEAHRARIRLHLEENDLPGAYQAARALLALDSRDPWANTALALHLDQTGRTEAAQAAQIVALDALPELARFFEKR